MADEEKKPSRFFKIGDVEVKEEDLVQTDSGWYLYEGGKYYKVSKGKYGDEYDIEGRNIPKISRKGNDYSSTDGQKIYGDASFLDEKSS